MVQLVPNPTLTLTQFLTRAYAALADATRTFTVKIHVCSYSEVLKAALSARALSAALKRGHYTTVVQLVHFLNAIGSSDLPGDAT